MTPDGKTLFVANSNDAVSTIDVKTRTKDRTDIAVGAFPFAGAVTPDGKTVFVSNFASGTVSTIDVKTRTKRGTIAVGLGPLGGRSRPTARPSSPPITAATGCRRLI